MIAAIVIIAGLATLFGLILGYSAIRFRVEGDPIADQIDALLPKIQGHIDDHYPDSLAKAWKFILGPGGGSLIEARFTGAR